MLGRHYVEVAGHDFRRLKAQADQTVAQLSPAQLFEQIDPHSNSIAVLLKHVGGNLKSRWTDFLVSDGEKRDRDRDSEFEAHHANLSSILEGWDSGWECLFSSLETLGEYDLEACVRIRGEEHTIVQAVTRSLSHVAGHVGQIVFLGKHLAGSEWATLSIPRGESRQLNTALGRYTDP